MITAGIDMASLAGRTASCVIEWSHDRAVVSQLTTSLDDAGIVNLIEDSDKVGLESLWGGPSRSSRRSPNTRETDLGHRSTGTLKCRRIDSVQRIAGSAMNSSALPCSLYRPT